MIEFKNKQNEIINIPEKEDIDVKLAFKKMMVSSLEDIEKALTGYEYIAQFISNKTFSISGVSVPAWTTFTFMRLYNADFVGIACYPYVNDFIAFIGNINGVWNIRKI